MRRVYGIVSVRAPHLRDAMVPLPPVFVPETDETRPPPSWLQEGVYKRLQQLEVELRFQCSVWSKAVLNVSQMPKHRHEVELDASGCVVPHGKGGMYWSVDIGCPGIKCGIEEQGWARGFVGIHVFTWVRVGPVYRI